MQDFKNILVWQKAHELVKLIYETTSLFPSHELYGITSQLRRAVVSIPANIAEGAGKGTNADFCRFLQIAFGSACEVEYLLFLSFELNYLSKETYDKSSARLTEIKRMLSGLMKKLKTVN